MTEFALVLPVLVAFLAGIIDFGVVLSDQNSERQGTRDGARQGVVSNIGSDTSCTVTMPSGQTLDSNTNKLVCLTKNRIGLSQPNLRLKVYYPSTIAAGNSMMVCSMYPAKSTTGLLTPFLASSVIQTKVEMRIERIAPATPIPAGAEAPLSGQTWSWCA